MRSSTAWRSPGSPIATSANCPVASSSVFIARALLGRPQLLVMDEPTSGVDVRTRHEILHLLGDLHRDGLAVLLTTHDLNGIAAHLPHLVCLNTEIIGSGSPAAVLTADILERTFGAPMEASNTPACASSSTHIATVWPPT